MRTRLFYINFCFIALLSIVSSNAFAQEKTFADYIQNAKDAYDAENYPVAIDNLLAANRLQPNARLLFNVAKSYDKLGECGKAIVYFKAFLRADNDEKDLTREADKAVKNSDKCSSFNATASGRLVIKSDPPGAVVRIDGTDRGVTPTEIGGLPEGKHLISLDLEGYENYREEVDLIPDADKTIFSALQEKKEEVVVQPDPDPIPDPDPVVKQTTERGTVPYIIAASVGGVGVILLVVGLITDLSTIPGIDDERANLDPDRTDYDREYRDLTDDRKGAATLALVMYISGGTLIAGGLGYFAYLLATEPKPEAPPVAGDLKLTPTFGTQSAGLQLKGYF